jgi:hypothetical protein
MVFAKPTDSSTFMSGMTDWKHVHQRGEEHEKSNMHRSSAEAYLLRSSSVCPHRAGTQEKAGVCPHRAGTQEKAGVCPHRAGKQEKAGV